MLRKVLIRGVYGIGSFMFGTYSLMKCKELIRKDEDKLNIVFDLDHTLIHSKVTYDYNSQNNKIFRNPSTTIRLNSDKNPNDYYEYHVFERPFSKFVLSQLSKFTKLHLYTASVPEYADEILDKCYNDIPFEQRFYRVNCNNHQKNLDLIQAKRKILVDDRKYCHIEGQNFYHIPPYYFYNNTDIEMIKLFYKMLVKA